LIDQYDNEVKKEQKLEKLISGCSPPVGHVLWPSSGPLVQASGGILCRRTPWCSFISSGLLSKHQQSENQIPSLGHSGIWDSDD